MTQCSIHNKCTQNNFRGSYVLAGDLSFPGKFLEIDGAVLFTKR